MVVLSSDSIRTWKPLLGLYLLMSTFSEARSLIFRQKKSEFFLARISIYIKGLTKALVCDTFNKMY